MHTLPIGLFDSGIGGMTVLAAMRRCMPGEDFLYLGDTARLPYGTKSADTVIRYAVQASARLVEHGIKMLVVACNTVSAVALPALRAAYPNIPVQGVVGPGARAACEASQRGHIAVIATPSTVRGGAYRDAILHRRPGALVESRACPLFVPLAEEAWVEGPVVEGVAARYLDPLFRDRPPRERPDCLVLGCTHYPLLAGAIRAVIGPEPALVDSAATTAQAVQGLMQREGLGFAPSDSPPARQGRTRFFTTDDVDGFARAGQCFLGGEIASGEVTLVDL